MDSRITNLLNQTGERAEDNSLGHHFMILKFTLTHRDTAFRFYLTILSIAKPKTCVQPQYFGKK
jgi:hypothetical protein